MRAAFELKSGKLAPLNLGCRLSYTAAGDPMVELRTVTGIFLVTDVVPGACPPALRDLREVWDTARLPEDRCRGPVWEPAEYRCAAATAAVYGLTASWSSAWAGSWLVLPPGSAAGEDERRVAFLAAGC